MGMQCPKCGGRLGVANTAGNGSNRVYLLSQVAPFVDWYCDEFVARDRRCTNPECMRSVLTIELDIEDFIGALRYAQIDSPALTQSIIDWNAHIRENARVFKGKIEHARPVEEKGGGSSAVHATPRKQNVEDIRRDK